MIPITRPYLPDLEEYGSYLKGIWERQYLTNDGPLVRKLEKDLESFLNAENLIFLNNGTIALQIAIKALDLKGEVITTPFSYVATTSSIVWENCKPVFVDIDKNTFNIDTDLIESHITKHTSAILATHVFGNPCEVHKISEIAQKHNLKVIYDAAHCFGVSLNEDSIFNYGDLSTTSFHATKIFHTVEGGAITTKDPELAHKVQYMRSFGHKGPWDYWGLGINGKNSEIHAAMGLCMLPKIRSLIQQRKKLSQKYNSYLSESFDKIRNQQISDDVDYNYSYYPIVFSNEQLLLEVMKRLNEQEIYPRRYFYPSLNELDYVKKQPCPVSEKVAENILCLPLYPELLDENVEQISSIILEVVSK